MMGLTHYFDNSVAGSAHGVKQGGLTEQLNADIYELLSEARCE